MKYLLPVISLLLLFSCTKDSLTDEDSIIDGNKFVAQNPLPCLDDFGIAIWDECQVEDFTGNSIHCERIHLGTNTLSDESKSLLAEFCLETGDEIDFANESGEIITFSILGKTYGTTSSRGDTHDVCPDDPDRTIGYCYDKESILITMASINAELDFQIQLTNFFSFIDNEDFGTVGEMLSIGRKTSPTFRVIDFSAIVKQGTLSYDAVSDQVFYPEIDLLDKSFKNVITNERVDDFHSRRQMYYSDIGLVAFHDRDEVLWVRQ